MNPRIPLSTARDWSDETRGFLAAATPAAESPDGQGPPNILYTLAHHPHLLAPFLGFAGALASKGVLDRREAELLALRAAWNCRSAFEWGHHVEYGRAQGLSEAEVRCIALAPEDPSWDDRARLLLRVADELHAEQQLTDPTFDALRASFREAEIVEIVLVVGHYTMLSMLANATGVPIEARLPGWPDETP